jgi:hypothetical protein
MSIITPAAPTTATELSLTRLHLMRAGYLLMGVGLALVKWPVLSLPKATTGDLDAATTETVVSCSLVVVILAATPWRYVWRNYVQASGDRLR